MSILQRTDLKTLDDVDVRGKTVLVRVDLNVPMEHGRVSDLTRIRRLVPTLTELGVDYDIAIWYGLMAPAGTPRAIVDRLAAATQKIMGSPEMMARIRAGGAEPVWSKPEEFQAELRRESAFWQQTAKAMPHLVKK